MPVGVPNICKWLQYLIVHHVKRGLKRLMASGEVGAQCRAPACLCVLCGLPAAGKSTLAGEVLRTAALAGWRSAVIPYDDLIPDHAFQAKEMDGVVKLQESVIPLCPNVFTFDSLSCIHGSFSV